MDFGYSFLSITIIFHSLTPSYRFLFLSFSIAAILSVAQPMSASKIGSSDLARSVSEYSTRGGTSAYTCRVMYPSLSNVRRVLVSIFCDMSGMLLRSSLKRIDSVCWRFRMYITYSDHLSLILANTLRMGQSLNIVSFNAVLIANSFVYNNRLQK